jgi:hypothetical protein
VKLANKAFEQQQIRLTVLGESGWSGAAKLVHVNGSIATVYSVRAIESGAAIRIDSGDALLVGECRACRAGESQFEAQITLEQIIPSVTDLARLVAAIIEVSPNRTAPRTNGVPVEAHSRR